MTELPNRRRATSAARSISLARRSSESIWRRMLLIISRLTASTCARRCSGNSVSQPRWRRSSASRNPSILARISLASLTRSIEVVWDDFSNSQFPISSTLITSFPTMRPSPGSDLDARPNLLWSFHLGSTFRAAVSTVLTGSSNTLSNSAYSRSREHDRMLQQAGCRLDDREAMGRPAFILMAFGGVLPTKPLKYSRVFAVTSRILAITSRVIFQS
jgi:hypothetical protein